MTFDSIVEKEQDVGYHIFLLCLNVFKNTVTYLKIESSLNLHHTILSLTTLKKKTSKHCGKRIKGEIPGSNICSFSHSVFYPPKNKFQILVFS